MGVLDFTGFESGVLDELASYTGLVSIDTTSERTGAYCLKISPQVLIGGDSYAALGGIDPSTGYLDKTSGFTVRNTYVRFYFRIGTMPANTEPIFAITQSGSMSTYQMKLWLNSSGKLLYAGPDGTFIWTTVSTLATNTWYRIGVRSGSSTILDVDGFRELDGRFFDSSETDASGFVVLGIKDPTSTPSGTYYYDDVVVSDSGLPGVGDSYIQFPTANGLYTGYTASSGTKHGAVSTNPYSTGTYIGTPSAAAYTATHQSYGGTGTPATVKTFVVAADPGGGGGNFSTRLRSGSTDDDTTPSSLTTSPAVFQRIYQVGLNGAQWTTTTVNALEAGVVSTGAARAYASYLLVDNSFIANHIYVPSSKLFFNGAASCRSAQLYFSVGRLAVAGVAAPVRVTALVRPSGRLTFSGLASPNTGQVVETVGKLLMAGTLPASLGGTAFFAYDPSGRFFLIPDRRLVGWYTFYDQQGIRLTDSTLYEQHGSLNNMNTTSCWVNTVKGFGLDFDGVLDFVSVPSLNIDTSTSGSYGVVSFWMYWRGGGDECVVSLGNRLYFNSAASGFGFTAIPGADLYGISTAGLANTWVHIIAVFRNNNTGYRLYVNGVEQALTVITGSLDGSFLSPNLILGSSYGTTAFFDGVIANVKVYNGNITAADAAELAADGFAAKLDESALVRVGMRHFPVGPITLSGVTQNAGPVRYVYLAGGLLTFQDPTLLLWLRLEEGTGTSTVYDSSIYRRFGTMNNMENGDWTTDVPYIRYLYGTNYSLQFDGLNEYVQVSAAGLTNPEYTIVLWVNPGALPLAEEYINDDQDTPLPMAPRLVSNPPVLADWSPA